MKRGRERILALGLVGTKNHRYYSVHLCQNGKQHDKKVHKLVAEAFIPNPDMLPEIDHIDGNRLNNHVDNLRYCTHKGNMNNPITLKRFSEARKGEKNWAFGKHLSDETKKRLSESRMGLVLKSLRKPVLCIKDGQIIKRYDRLTDVKEDGFATSAVSLCCQRKQKFHKGYQWAYAVDYSADK